MKRKLYTINESILDSLLHRVKVLESLLLEGKRDQEILNNFLGDDYYNKYQAIKNKIKDPEYKDIYKLIKKDPDDVKDYIDNIQSSRDIRRTEKSGAKKIHEDDEWVVYKITTYDAAKYYGKGTKWCITGRYDGHEERGEEYFYDYIDRYNLDDGYYFYINKSNGDKYCLLQDVDGEIQSIWNANDDDLGSKNKVGLPEVQGVNLETVSPEDELLDGAYRGDITLVKKALSMGANFNTKDKHGNTVLTNAVLKGYPEIVKLLLDTGADVNVADDDGDTALIRAAARAYPEIIRLLLDAGADVNAKDNYNGTALIYASNKGHLENVKLLIDSGADVNVEDEEGKTALIYAASNNQDDVVELLIDSGADVNVKDNDGYTALMNAVYYGYHEIVKLLIDAGTDIDVKSKSGDTAIEIASREGYKDIIKLLVKHGAKSESRNRNRLNRKYLY